MVVLRGRAAVVAGHWIKCWVLSAQYSVFSIQCYLSALSTNHYSLKQNICNEFSCYSNHLFKSPRAGAC